MRKKYFPGGSHSSMLKHFSHIYVEKQILDHPRTLSILAKFKNSEVIQIVHYKDVFNRRGQNFRAQKLSQKLILAKREDHFLYPGSHFSPNFDHPHFYYNTLALNCIYDCSYCYLQGMFSSANLVFFVNWEDFFNATDTFLEKHKSLYLALSYDTDLLATESFFPAVSAWIEFAQSRRDLILEIRTKSSQFAAIQKSLPIPNCILAWTISPESICREIEKKTPSLSARLTAIQSSLEAGWKVRLCLDPILRVRDWQKKYEAFIQELHKQIDLDQVHDISIGSFRMNTEFLGNIQNLRADDSLLYYPYARQSGIASYPTSENEEMLSFVKACLDGKVKESKIKVSF